MSHYTNERYSEMVQIALPNMPAMLPGYKPVQYDFRPMPHLPGFEIVSSDGAVIGRFYPAITDGNKLLSQCEQDNRVSLMEAMIATFNDSLER